MVNSLIQLTVSTFRQSSPGSCGSGGPTSRRTCRFFSQDVI